MALVAQCKPSWDTSSRAQLVTAWQESATSLVVRTNHVLTTTIVAVVVAMASVKTLHTAPRSKRKRLRHALPHVLPTKKSMASVVVVAARPS